MKCPNCREKTSVYSTSTSPIFVTRYRTCRNCLTDMKTVEIDIEYYKRIRYDVKNRIQDLLRRVEEHLSV